MAEVNNVDINNVSPATEAFKLSSINFNPVDLYRYYEESPDLSEAWKLICELFIRCINKYSADEHTIFVVKERRAFVLFLIFLYTKGHKEYANIIYRKFYSDTDFIDVLRGMAVPPKRIILIDDIVIHGRAVKKIMDEVHKSNPDIEIIVECCMKYEGMEFDVDVVTTPNYDSVTESFWKNMSNKFVSIIQHSGLSYSSFAPIFSYKSYPDLSFMSTDNKTGKIAITTSSKNNKLDGSLYIWLCNKEKPLIEKSAIKNFFSFFIRKYTFEQISAENICDNSIYVPFVILPVIALKNVNNTNCNFAIGKYKNLTYQYSKKIMESINTNKKIEGENIYECFNPIVFSDKTITSLDLYGEEFSEFENRITLSNKSLEIWNESLSKWKPDAEIEVNMQKIIDCFIGRLHKINEDRAKMRMSRLPGAFVISMLNKICEYTSCSIDDLLEPFFSVMISRWDSGIANYTVDVILHDGVYYVGGSITDGEQAYHAELEPDAENEIGLFKYIYSKCGKLKTISALQMIIEDYTGNSINKEHLKFIIDYMNSSKSTNYKELFDFVKHKTLPAPLRTLSEHTIKEMKGNNAGIQRNVKRYM